MAEFLDTTATHYHLERLLQTAEERVVLVSPCLKLRPRLRELIEDAARREVVVQLVSGKNDECAEMERLRRLRGVQTSFGQNVRARCYLNETFGMITSLNLSDFSEAQNQEMGVLFQRADDARLYQQAQEEARRIIRHSEASVQKSSAPFALAPEMQWQGAPAFHGNLAPV